MWEVPSLNLGPEKGYHKFFHGCTGAHATTVPHITPRFNLLFTSYPIIQSHIIKAIQNIIKKIIN
jgi:hypothetical protein